LSAAEHEQTRQVRAAIEREVAASGGWIGFDRYMEMSLYAPGLGYYSAGARKLGRDGDFTTAPEVSRLFGACVARQCAEVLQALPAAMILEIGAGTGKLAVDVLQTLDAAGVLPERYAIIEVSADLRERQRESIAALAPDLARRVEWLDELPVQEFEGVVLANEVLDALPVVRFRWSVAGVEELGVALEDDPSRNSSGNFVWAARPASADLQAQVNTLAQAAGNWEAGYASECCPRLEPWTRSVTASLRRGVVLWFDYGLPRSQYYLGERHEGTLLCHHRHRAYEDPFRLPGLQDITAWVDFTSVAEAGVAAEFELAGFTTQAFFLAGLGIDREMQRLAHGDPARFARLANEAKQLMLPGEMGERFKAMAWIRDLELPLTGFALQDLRHTL
jgi:SAM-dependent MidA family methyltransferase